MPYLLLVTLKGVLRDRIYHGILLVALLFFFIPTISSFSMRQVTELAITLSLSLTSFLLLVLAVFLGGTTLWKDLGQRYANTVLGGTPIGRTSYLFGKYLGVSVFVLVTTLLLGLISIVTIWFTASVYPPDRPLMLVNISLAVFFDALKYVLLIAVAFLLSTVSTSFFLPIFGTIATFIAGSSTQAVFDYLHTDQGALSSVVIKAAALLFYYLLPNFSAFDLKANAIYGLPLDTGTLLLTMTYALVYIVILLTIASMLFTRRELR